MRNLDSCRCWQCTLCPCKVRNKSIVNSWNRTILLCTPRISSRCTGKNLVGNCLRHLIHFLVLRYSTLVCVILCCSRITINNCTSTLYFIFSLYYILVNPWIIVFHFTTKDLWNVKKFCCILFCCFHTLILIISVHSVADFSHFFRIPC